VHEFLKKKSKIKKERRERKKMTDAAVYCAAAQFRRI
jgi:hypothetical protein